MKKASYHSKDIITKEAVQTLALDIALYILKLNVKDLIWKTYRVTR